MKYLSVCDGIGAAHVAWKPLGWSCVGASEIERFPIEVVRQRHPEIAELGDMTKYHAWKNDQPDLVCGGTPCQSFSVAGLRKGMADPRGNLALVFLGIVDHFRPRWVVWENVPGVLSSEGGRDFGAFLGGLGQLGYGFAYRVFDAQYFGLAQRRKRVFVVGCLGNWRSAAAVLFERHSLQGYPPPSRETGKGVAGTFKACADSGGWSNSADHAAAGYMIPVANTLLGKPNSSHAADQDTYIAHTLKGEGFDASEDGTGRGVPLVPELSSAIKARDHKGPSSDGDGDGAPLVPIMVRMREGKDGGGKGPLVSEDQSLTLATSNDQVLAFRGGESQQDTLHTEAGIMSTLPAGSNGNGGSYTKTQVGMQVRRLTPRECERLQGFPDDYTSIDWSKRASIDKIAADVMKYYERTGYTGDRLVQAALCPDGPRYKALGNSWAVPVVRWIGQRIEQVDAIISKAVAA